VAKPVINFHINIPLDLHSRLMKEAEKNNRKLTPEIISRLAESMERDDPPDRKKSKAA